MLAWSLVLLLAPWHDTTTSVGRLVVSEQDCTFHFLADADRVMQSLGFDEPDGTPWTAEQITQARPQVLEYLVDRLEFSHNGERLALEPLDLVALRGFEPLLQTERIQELEASFRWPVPTGDFQFQVRHRLFEEAETGHTHLLTLVLGDQEQGPHVLVPRQTLELGLEDPTPDGLVQRRWRFGEQGWINARRHWELLAFVVLVLLGLSGWRAEVWVLVAFLVGVGAPLWLVGQDALSPSPRAVGLAVHLSLGWMLIELLVLRDGRLRWATSGLLGVVFGLDLGLGFAPPLLGPTGCLASYHAGAMVAVLGAGVAGLGAAAAWRRISRGRTA